MNAQASIDKPHKERPIRRPKGRKPCKAKRKQR